MPDSLIRTSTSASLPTDKQAANCGTVSVPCAMQPTTITLTVHSMRTAGRVQALPTNIRRPRLFSKPGTNQTVTTLPISWKAPDYFRIQNITLGYSFKNLKIGSYVMPGLRLSLTADRPFTTFKANSFTPEVSDAEGWDTEVYPLTSTYTFGVQIDF